MKRKVLLVGGPARCGKSTLAKMIRQKVDGQVLSGDALSRAIRNSINVDWIPDLFAETIDKVNLSDPYDIQINRLRRRDQALWPFIKNYISDAVLNSTDNILVDSNFWPDYLPELEPEHRAVFLVDTSPDRAKWLIKIRDTDGENNWMRKRKYSDEKIIRWAEFDKARSRAIIELCKEYGYTYFDIAEHGIDGVQKLAMQYLLK